MLKIEFEQKLIRMGHYLIQQVEKNSEELYKMRLLQAERSQSKEVTSSKRVGWLLEGHVGSWVYGAEDLTSADWAILSPD